MRILGIVLALVVVVAGLWYFTGTTTQDDLAQLPEVEPLDSETIETEDATDTAQGDTGMTDTGMTETPSEEVSDNFDAITETAEENVNEITDDVTAGSESPLDAAEENTEMTMDAIEEATEGGTVGDGQADMNTDMSGNDDMPGNDTDSVGLTDETDAEAEARLREVLTVESFEYDQALEAVDNSNLSAFERNTAIIALEEARDNPDQLEELLPPLRRELGLE